METRDMDMLAEAKAWQEKEFLPWKAAMEEYVDTRGQQLMKLKRSAGELQTIVAMLTQGRTKQAMLAWNALDLQPKLKDIRVGRDNLTLVGTDGQITQLMLDDMIAELSALLKS
ncbi:MAG: hypothetical protein EON60_02520 [Alphaproteobacteria bacterium]|nr:MAG: hypothetical protein EON60_02520 [Alphaproteobacteria bacterium]